MAKLQLVKDSTSKLVSVFIQDSSSVTGAGLTGLTSASSGLTAFYYREGAGTGATAISLVAVGSLGTWESGGFFEIDASDMPGWYELGLPDAVLATGVDSVGVQLKGAADMAQVNLEIQLNLVDDVWDEILTGATHNIATSAGRRLRQIEASFVVAAGTAQAGAAGTITLASGESATDDIFAGDRIVIVEGTGTGEHGIVTTYDGTTKIATMSQNWVITPDATSKYEIVPADADVETWQHVVVTNDAVSNRPAVDVDSNVLIRDTVASAISDSQFTLSAAASPNDDHYEGAICILIDAADTSIKQVDIVSDYEGSTRTVTIEGVFNNPTLAIGDTIIMVAQKLSSKSLAAGTLTNDSIAAGAITATEASVNISEVAGVAAAATNMSNAATTIVNGTVDTSAFAPTTTEFEADDITEATPEHYKGRIVIFTSGVLANQSADINDYSLSGANGHFTTSVMTEAPGNDDTFVIL